VFTQFLDYEVSDLGWQFGTLGRKTSGNLVRRKWTIVEQYRYGFLLPAPALSVVDRPVREPAIRLPGQGSFRAALIVTQLESARWA